MRAQPGAARSKITGVHDRMLKVAVTVAPEKGKANRAIVAVLSKQLGIAKSRLTVISGETSRIKRILVEGLTPEDLADRLRDVLEPDAKR